MAAERRALIRHGLWPAGCAFGIAAEWIGRPPLPGLDAAAGFVMIALGLLVWQARPRFAVGAIMTAAGFAWFLGTLAGWAVYLHRASLAQLILTYPARRLWPASWLERVGVVGAYAYAVDDRVAGNDQVTIVFALGLLAVAAWRYLGGGGPVRRARASSLTAASAFVVMLILGAALRLGGVATGLALLVAYEIVVLLVAAGLFVDLLWGAWTQATVTALVVDLGEPAAAGTLRDRLARTLGDPTLAIGYWLDEQDEYVDEAGRSLALPAGDGQRAVELIEDAGRPLAALIHDPAILDDPALLAGITAATRLAVANARLQAEVRARLEQVMASRRRLVEAADEQRRQLERELRQASEQRLINVAELLADGNPLLAEANTSLTAARAELSELARGIHPATLTEAGLTAALTELAARSPVPVKLIAPEERWPAAVEAGAYFICSEALANIAKYARATAVLIEITDTPTELRVEVTDDGIGGADPTAGSGLRGLTDRADARADTSPSPAPRITAPASQHNYRSPTCHEQHLDGVPASTTEDNQDLKPSVGHDCFATPAGTPTGEATAARLYSATRRPAPPLATMLVLASTRGAAVRTSSARLPVLVPSSHSADVTPSGVAEPRSGRLATVAADLPLLSHGHLVGDSTGPAARGNRNSRHTTLDWQTRG